jgi:hypothetical protein
MFCVASKDDVIRRGTQEVFYRGIRACPWAKKVYLMAFGELKGLMDFNELRAVYRVLAEKELRVHVDLEDRLDEWDEQHGMKRIGY